MHLTLGEGTRTETRCADLPMRSLGFDGRARGWQLVVGMMLLLAHAAWADGKMFSRVVAAPVAMPDQRAMLHYSNGLERLVIETAFSGEGTNFAWVVPLPTAPDIQAVSTNFFPMLATSFQPKLVHPGASWWLLYLFVGLVALAPLARKYGGRPACAVVAAVFIGFVGGVVLLPSFVKARGSAIRTTAVSGVEVVGRQSVGIYDTVTLASASGEALLRWLNTNGFFTPTSAVPVIADYARQGWVFVGARVSRDRLAPSESLPHPLAFTFRSEKPVYPLRLTGIENQSCAIELFVFGPARAAASGFRVKHCGHPVFPAIPSADDLGMGLLHAGADRTPFVPPAPGQYRLRHPEVRRLGEPAAVVTKLAGDLSPKQMQSDVWIQWTEPEPVLPVLYSESAALDAALNWLVGTGVLGLILVGLVLPEKVLRPRLRQAALAVLLGASSAGAVRYWTLEMTEISIARGYSDRIAVSRFSHFAAAVEQLAMERTQAVKDGKAAGGLTFDEFRSALLTLRYDTNNVFTDAPIRHQATPGDVVLRETTNGIEVLWHDIDGVPYVLANLPPPAPSRSVPSP